MISQMEIKPIKNAADHAAALREINGLMSAELGTPEGDRLDVLATLVEAYEARHFPMEPDQTACGGGRVDQGSHPRHAAPRLGLLAFRSGRAAA
jgi:HTH-type transcriptional regulator/antitoxin HigA